MRENIFIELISLLNNGTKNYGISEEVDILMGKNKLPKNFKENFKDRFEKIKRNINNGR